MVEAHTPTDQKLDPELKAKWLEALRSEQYKQGSTCLRSQDDCYCCLGVLATLIEPMEWTLINHEWHWQAQCEGAPVDEEDEPATWDSERTELLPGMENKIPRDTQLALAKLNDGQKEERHWDTDEVIKPFIPAKNFTEIADYIEANL